MAEGESLRRDTDRIAKLLGEQIDRADRYKNENEKLKANMAQLLERHKKEISNKNFEIKRLTNLLALRDESE